MKELSIVIPVYNEERILENEINKMVFEMGAMFPRLDYELLLVENGSVDRTKTIIDTLIKKYPFVIRAMHLPAPSYGLALISGLLQNNGKNAAIFNVDFWDLEFLQRALALIPEYDIVVGSKNMPGAQDKRSFSRRLITKFFNILLKLLFGFKGTDTHGIKLFVSDKIKPIVKLCRTDQEIFDTELILRAQKMGLKMTELPVGCEEKRKTRLSLLKSARRTIRGLILLIFYLRD